MCEGGSSVIAGGSCRNGKQTDTASPFMGGEVSVFYLAKRSAVAVGNGNIDLLWILPGYNQPDETLILRNVAAGSDSIFQNVTDAG